MAEYRQRHRRALAPVGTAPYANKTLASLGLGEGIYTYTWGSDLTAESLTIDIAAVPDPPLASTAD